MKPLTRKEMLLDGAAKDNLDTFKPATREEVFAKRALANTGGSGGSGITVVQLFWDEETQTITANMTATEIANAVEAGEYIIARPPVSPAYEGVQKFGGDYVNPYVERYDNGIHYVSVDFICWTRWGVSVLKIHDENGNTTVRLDNGIDSFVMRAGGNFYIIKVDPNSGEIGANQIYFG